MTHLFKILILFSIVTGSLYSDDFSTLEEDLKKMKETTDLAEHQKLLMNYKIVEQGIKDGIFEVKVTATLKETYQAYTGQLSKVGLVLYIDGKKACTTKGTQLLSKRIKTEENGYYENVVHSKFSCSKRVSGFTYPGAEVENNKSHTFALAMQRWSKHGYPYLILAHHSLMEDTSSFENDIKKMQRHIKKLQTKIAQAQQKCKEEIKKIEKKMQTATPAQRQEGKDYIISKSQSLLLGECSIETEAGEQLSVLEMQEKILNYRYQQDKLKHQLSPDTKATNLVEIHDRMLKKVDTLLPTDEFPSYLNALGFTKIETTNKKEIEAWRTKIRDGLEKNWAKTLTQGDLRSIQETLRKELNIINKFTDAKQRSEDAIYDIIEANQQLTNDLITTIPGVDDATDILGLLRGEDLAGNKLTLLDYMMQFGPAAILKLSSSKTFKKALKNTSEQMDVLKKGTKSSLAQKMNVVIEKLEIDPKKLSKKRVTQNKLRVGKMEVLNSTEWKESQKIFKRAQRSAEKRVKKLKRVIDEGTDKKVKRAIEQLYKDKSAKTLLIGTPAFQDLQEKTVKKMGEIYDKVDNKVIQSLTDDEHVKKYMKRYANEGKMVKIETLNITNAKTKISLGRDRDVTFYALFEKNGKTKRFEVPHHLAEETYKKELFLSYRGKVSTSTKELNKFYDEMEQVVTSSKHMEAYSIPKGVAIEDFFKKDALHGFGNIEDQIKTVKIKSKEFFNQSQKYAKMSAELKKSNPNKAIFYRAKAMQEMTEGMRQASKQYKNMILPRAKKYLGSTHKIPFEVSESMKLYEKVGKGLISPDEANALIKKVFKKSPDDVITNTATYLQKLEMVSKVAYNKAQKSLLTQTLKGLKRIPTSRGFIQAIRISNRSLHKEELNEQEFTKIRQDFFKDYLTNLPKEAKEKKALLAWIEKAYPKEITKVEYVAWKKALKGALK